MSAQFVTVAEDVDFGEGVVVLPDGAGIAFCETGGQALSVFDGSRARRIASVHGAPNGMALGPDGALYVANNGGIGPDPSHQLWVAEDSIDGCIQRLTLDGTVTDYATGLPGITPHRPNDLCFDDHGRLYFTDSGNWEAFFHEPTDFRSSPPGYNHGALFVVQPDGEVQRIAEMTDFPNGLVVTADRRHLIAAQTVLLKLVVFPLHEDGTVGEPELYAHTPEPILPDGICLAADGTLFACGAVGDGIAVIGPDRALVDVLELGEHTDPTNCALDDEGRLWVTMGVGRRLGYIETEHRPLPLIQA